MQNPVFNRYFFKTFCTEMILESVQIRFLWPTMVFSFTGLQ